MSPNGILKMSKTRFICARKSWHVDHRGEIRQRSAAVTFAMVSHGTPVYAQPYRGLKSHPLRHTSLVFKGYRGIPISSPSIWSTRLTLSLRPGHDAAILPKLNPGFKTYAPTPVRRSSTPRRALKTYMRACPSERRFGP